LVTVKNARYLLYQKYWTDWREAEDFQRFPRLEDYVKYRLKEDYGVDSEEEGIKVAFAELAKSLKKCNYLLKNCPRSFKGRIGKSALQNPIRRKRQNHRKKRHNLEINVLSRLRRIFHVVEFKLDVMK